MLIGKHIKSLGSRVKLSSIKPGSDLSRHGIDLNMAFNGRELWTSNRWCLSPIRILVMLAEKSIGSEARTVWHSSPKSKLENSSKSTSSPTEEGKHNQSVSTL